MSPNRLAREKSPYLLQHAANPVDWYPWGEEAFEKARREDRPLFLSIGYSTCHWCHVMERESFEQEEIGRILNEHFVSIKVDREERPDIDHIYMTVCQALTGSGGWPLTIVMTPEREPFFAGTYFPPESRFGRPGLKEILYQIVGAWEGQRERVLDAARRITEAVTPHFGSSPGEELGEETLYACAGELAGRFDEMHGGFGAAPKFPTAHVFFFLLRFWSRTGDGRALEMVERTLQAMRRGGIYDHVGFGFHRYSTDREWLVPHFEKMLYDQALLMMAYTETYQATGQALYGAVAREIATYVLTEMTTPEGAFASAEDADSEGVEGKYYVWRRSELDQILGKEDAALYARVYRIQEEGNWSEEATGHKEQTNIPHLGEDPARAAAELERSPQELALRLEASRQKLVEARRRRVRPHKDDKVLTAWNGLMIAALGKAAQALEEKAYVKAAERALTFLSARLVDPDGRLLARYRDGESTHPAYLDDYAFLAWGLLELYEATLEPRHLDAALKLAADMERLFWDERDGGFFFTGADAEVLLARTKESYDGALPSGNSVAALVLLRLSRMTGDPDWERLAGSLFRSFAGVVGPLPSAHTLFLTALDFALGPTREIVIVSPERDAEAMAMIREARRGFLPRKVILACTPDRALPLGAVAPFAAGLPMVENRATAYVCEHNVCRAPLTSAGELASVLHAPIPGASS